MYKLVIAIIIVTAKGRGIVVGSKPSLSIGIAKQIEGYRAYYPASYYVTFAVINNPS